MSRAPLIATEHDFPAAMETGIAAATLGLIIACVLGGPIAKYLIKKYGLQTSPANAASIELAPEDDKAPIDKLGVMHAMLVVNIAVILGYLVHHWIPSATTIKLPLFVPCLIMGILLSNTCPKLFPRWPWPAQDCVARSHFKLFAVNLPRYVPYEHAALDFGQNCGTAACHRSCADPAGGDLYLARGLSCTGEDYQAAVLSAWILQHIPWFNANGDRNHDGGHQTLRRIAQCFCCFAPGISFIRQSHQCRRDYVVPVAMSYRRTSRAAAAFLYSRDLIGLRLHLFAFEIVIGISGTHGSYDNGKH